MAAGAALGVVTTALVMNLGSVPAGETGSAADPAVITAALQVEAAPIAPVPAPAMPEGAGVRYTRAASGALAGETLQVARVRVEPRARSAFDRDPRLADAAFARAPVDPEAAAAAEAALELTRRDRRAVQRRLALAEHDPRLVDGIFGPATRAAISAWQQAMGLSPTGFLDGQALVLLEWQTEDRYRAWATAEARERRRRTQTAAADNAGPQTASAGACQRLGTGQIAYGQNVRCDFRGLRENLALLFRRAERS